MKQVISNNEETVSVSDVNTSRCYGVVYSVGGAASFSSIGFITHCPLNGGFVVRSAKELTIGTRFFTDFKENFTLHRLVSKLLNHPNVKVYEFETADELYTWMAEAPA